MDRHCDGCHAKEDRSGRLVFKAGPRARAGQSLEIWGFQSPIRRGAFWLHSPSHPSSGTYSSFKFEDQAVGSCHVQGADNVWDRWRGGGCQVHILRTGGKVALGRRRGLAPGDISCVKHRSVICSEWLPCAHAEVPVFLSRPSAASSSHFDVVCVCLILT